LAELLMRESELVPVFVTEPERADALAEVSDRHLNRQEWQTLFGREVRRLCHDLLLTPLAAILGRRKPRFSCDKPRLALRRAAKVCKIEIERHGRESGALLYSMQAFLEFFPRRIQD
jgi:hypothetical protein